MLLYYDEFEINNALLNCAGKHKIGGLYYCIANLPPEYASLIENVFLGQFIYSKDQKRFGNEICFQKIIEETKFLSESGIMVSNEGYDQRDYFVVLGVLGDNLGLNAIFGFKESFSGTYFCRICQASKLQTEELCDQCNDLLRNEENYKTDV